MKSIVESSFTVFLLLCLFSVFGCGNDGEESGQSSMSLRDDQSDSLVIVLEGRDSVSVLDLLLESHDAETKSSAMGQYVTRIDSLENSMDAFWLFSVNDTMPQVSCDRMLTRGGDRVVWHYRKID